MGQRDQRGEIQVTRSSDGIHYSSLGFPTTNGFTDTTMTPDTFYLYSVVALNAAGYAGPPNADLTTMMFTDAPLIAGMTTMKAAHVMELRTAVNAVRALAGLPEATFTDPSLTGGVIKTVHLDELRTNLNTAGAALGLSQIFFAEPSLTPGVAGAEVEETLGQ